MRIPQSKPLLTKDDFDYIDQILRTHQVAEGPQVEALEKAFCLFLRVQHAIAVSTGTAGIHLALMALGMGPGDEVIVPSYVCANVLNAIHQTGAEPSLVDIDLAHFNPAPDIIRSAITPKTRAVIVTHTFGFPADLQPIIDMGIPVIEDCAQSLGARYDDHPVGSLGRLSVFSFHATKIICSGEGGIVCTNDKALADTLRDLNTPDMRSSYKVRCNYRMSDLTAGLALSQFQKLQSFVQRRREIARRYDEVSLKFGMSTQLAIPNSVPVYYRYVILSDHADSLIRETRGAGIFCDRPVYCPGHRYLKLNPHPKFTGTEAVWRDGVSVPIWPGLSDREVSYIISVLGETLERIA